jgi:hypothetical protein
MKKRINFTGRKKLASEYIDIRINRQEGQRYASFVATFHPDLTKGLDKDAKVYVEPYAVSSSMRFDFGTVSNPIKPADTTLSQLDRDDAFLFRVKVVDESGNVGRILADANGIRPQDADDDGTAKKALFPVHFVDLGELIWRVEYDQSNGPVLQVTTKISDLPNLLKNDPIIQGSIYPQALREVLQILMDENAAFVDDADWVKNWREFVLKLTGVDLEDDQVDGDDPETFVENTVRQYARLFSFASKAKQAEEAQV